MQQRPGESLWTEEHGGLQSMGFQRVGQDQETKWASLVAQRLKRLPAMGETWVRSLGQKNPLEKAMATYSSIFDPMDRRGWRAVVHGVTKS